MIELQREFRLGLATDCAAINFLLNANSATFEEFFFHHWHCVVRLTLKQLNFNFRQIPFVVVPP
jgi:hypothetical protein